MKRHRCKLPTGFAPRPREYLEWAESWAIKIQKLLHENPGIPRGPGVDLQSVGDAIQVANLIELLAGSGRRANAAEAMAIAERVELLADVLRSEIDCLLATHNQSGER